MCLCSVFSAVGGQLVPGVAPAPVLNGCEQGGRRLLRGLCPQPWRKASHQQPELESLSGSLLCSVIFSFSISQMSYVFKSITQ